MLGVDRKKNIIMQQACDSCRLRKMKCSKEYPQCLKCKEHAWNCVYSPRRIRTPLTRTYVSKVEKRAQNLEKLLKRILPEDVEINDLLRTQNNSACESSEDFNEDDGISNKFYKQINLTTEELRQVPITLKNIDKISQKKAKETRNEKRLEYQPEDYLINIRESDLNSFDERGEIINKSEVLYDSSIDGMAALSNDTGLNFDLSNSNGYFGINSSNGLLKFLQVKSEKNGNSILELNLNNSNDQIEYDDQDYEENYILDEDISVIWKSIKSGKIDDLLDNLEFQAIVIDSFFETYYNVYPFINKKNFFTQYAKFKNTMELVNYMYSDEFNDYDSRLLSFQVLLNTILAIGVWCKIGENSNLHYFYYQRVRSLIQHLNIFEYSDINLLESFVLLSNYVQKTNKPNTGWSYLGLSTRIATSLGLHKEVKVDVDTFTSGTDHNDSLNLKLFENIEARKRLWWGMYFFDVGTTLTFGRPLTIPPLATIDLGPVSNVDDKILSKGASIKDSIVHYPTIYTTLIYESELTKISTRIYNYNSSVLKLKNDKSKMIGLLEMNELLVDFVKALPIYFNEDEQISKEGILADWRYSDYNDSKNPIPPWLSLSRLRLICRYKNLRILIFRYILWESVYEKEQDAAYLNLIKKCHQVCFDSAIETISLIDTYINNYQLDYLSSWYATYFLFQAVLIPILQLVINYNALAGANGQDETNFSQEAELFKFIDIAKFNFDKLKRFNKLAGKFRKLIDSLVSGKKIIEHSADNFNWYWDDVEKGLEMFGNLDENFDSNFYVQ